MSDSILYFVEVHYPSGLAAADNQHIFYLNSDGQFYDLPGNRGVWPLEKAERLAQEWRLRGFITTVIALPENTAA